MQDNFLNLIMTPTQPGKLVLDYIDKRLVPAIRLLREQSTPRNDVTQLWRQLGKAILQHDLARKPDIMTLVLILNCTSGLVLKNQNLHLIVEQSGIPLRRQF